MPANPLIPGLWDVVWSATWVAPSRSRDPCAMMKRFDVVGEAACP